MPPPLRGHDFWREVLGSPSLVVAPMVDASELAWRMLSRKYRAQLCYTPMLHGAVFVRDARYRREALLSCSEDRPLVVQFCANDPDVFVAAARLAAPFCDAVDLNLGCPQTIAKKGRYGAYLQDDWDLLRKMVEKAYSELQVPITCKVRVFPEVEKTVRYAQMLEAAGCQLLTVHGRTREQKGPFTGLASWEHIRAVKEAVKIPVFANGNIQYLDDALRCLRETGVEGIMSAEGNLHNPAIFAGIQPPVWQMAQEYLELVHRYPCPISYTRGHLFKLFHHLLNTPSNLDLRMELAKGSTLWEFEQTVGRLRDRHVPFHLGDATWEHSMESLAYPPWICQPYIRPPPKDTTASLKRPIIQDQLEEDQKVTAADITAHSTLSKKKLKKLQRYPNKRFGAKEVAAKCLTCPNPLGLKCPHQLCRACCRVKCFEETLDCIGHKLLVRSKRSKSSANASPSAKTEISS